MKVKRVTIYLLTLVLAVSVLTVAYGCGPPITGSGKLETKEYDYSDFTKVSVGSGFVVTVTRGDSFSVSITADDNIFQYLDIRKVGNTLYVALKRPRIYLHTTQEALVEMPALRVLELSGASRGDVSGFSTADSLKIELSGASNLDLDDMKAGDTDFDVSGASRVDGSIEIADGDFNISGASTFGVEGSAGDVSIEVSGASSAKLGNFAVVDVTVEVSGASNATINAGGRLNADISGASRLYYLGNPTLGDIEVSGASTVSQK